MRITPKREHLAYLKSIGISNKTIAGPQSISSKGRKVNHKAPGRVRQVPKPARKPPSPVRKAPSRVRATDYVRLLHENRTVAWWVFVVTTVLVLFLAILARAQELEPQRHDTIGFKGFYSQKENHHQIPRLDSVNTEVTIQREALPHAVTSEQFAIHEAKLEVIERQQGFRWLIILFTVVGVQGIGLLIIKNILENRLRQVEQIQPLRLRKKGIDGNASSKSASESASPPVIGDAKLPPTKKVVAKPARFRPMGLPTSCDVMQKIVDDARKSHQIQIKPSLPSEPWKLGLTTDKGNVRSENQDYGLCFQINGHEVLIVADGCGGVRRGKLAAYLAAKSSAVSIVSTFGKAPPLNSPEISKTVYDAITAAANKLSLVGDKLNITDIAGGLRTTLILIIGNRSEVGFGYIGDGGGCVIKSSGEVTHFLNPQKADDFAMNVLSASLGPKMEGEPVIGNFERVSGDLVIVGTDGVFDRVDKQFPRDVLRGCIYYEGDLQKTTEHIVAELASFKDGLGYICDDNLTLGIMGNGAAPQQPVDIWTKLDKALYHPENDPKDVKTSC